MRIYQNKVAALIRIVLTVAPLASVNNLRLNVDAIVGALIAGHHNPGVSVGILLAGQRHV